jgi:hypothetical protein
VEAILSHWGRRTRTEPDLAALALRPQTVVERNYVGYPADDETGAMLAEWSGGDRCGQLDPGRAGHVGLTPIRRQPDRK